MNRYFLLAFLLCACTLSLAQSNDEGYRIPTKEELEELSKNSKDLKVDANHHPSEETLEARAKAIDGIKRQAKYCTSLEDLKADNWKDAGILEIDATPGNMRQFEFKSEDNNMKTILKKESFAIAFGDSLYLNSRKIKLKESRLNKDYSLGYRLKDGRFLVLANHNSFKPNVALWTYQYGLIGAAVSIDLNENTQQYDDSRLCIIIDKESDPAILVNELVLDELIGKDISYLSKTGLNNKKNTLPRAEQVVSELTRKGLIIKN